MLLAPHTHTNIHTVCRCTRHNHSHWPCPVCAKRLVVCCSVTTHKQWLIQLCPVCDLLACTRYTNAQIDAYQLHEWANSTHTCTLAGLTYITPALMGCLCFSCMWLYTGIQIVQKKQVAWLIWSTLAIIINHTSLFLFSCVIFGKKQWGHEGPLWKVESMKSGLDWIGQLTVLIHGKPLASGYCTKHPVKCAIRFRIVSMQGVWQMM